MNSAIRCLVIGLIIMTARAQTSDTLANTQTKKILNYLQGLSSRMEKRLVSGHQLNLQYPASSSYDSVVSPIFMKTGKSPGLIGVDYQRNSRGPMSSMTSTNVPLIRHAGNGGFAAVMCSFSNPWTDSTSNDTTGRHRMAELLQPGTAAYGKWMQRLDSVARGLRQLQDSGITVFFRPLHEMNGTWFWWGSQSSLNPSKQLWTALWVQMHTYFTAVKQLHNILWVYSPTARSSSISSPAFRHDTAFYPGKEYVDIVGVDVYEDTLDIPSYQSLLSFGKPMALCEFGPSVTSADTAYQYDYRTMLQQIKNKYPKIVYWMSWNDFNSSKGSRFYGMTNQNNISEVLADPWVVNQADIQWSTATQSQRSGPGLPTRFTLVQNFPNPFNPSTIIRYTVPDAGAVTLTVYDCIGRVVVRLADGYHAAGTYSKQFDASPLATGVYAAELRSGANVQVKKMILIK